MMIQFKLTFFSREKYTIILASIILKKILLIFEAQILKLIPLTPYFTNVTSLFPFHSFHCGFHFKLSALKCHSWWFALIYCLHAPCCSDLTHRKPWWIDWWKHTHALRLKIYTHISHCVRSILLEWWPIFLFKPESLTLFRWLRW